jgi:hypothetical protein
MADFFFFRANEIAAHNIDGQPAGLRDWILAKGNEVFAASDTGSHGWWVDDTDPDNLIDNFIIVEMVSGDGCLRQYVQELKFKPSLDQALTNGFITTCKQRFPAAFKAAT